MKFFSLLAVLVLFGCSSKKKIQGSFFIERFDEGGPLYYIVEKGVEDGGGVFDGIIKEIGWKDNKLLADVQRLSSGDPSGWYLLNLETGKVDGPITDKKIIFSFSTTSAAKFFENPSAWKK